MAFTSIRRAAVLLALVAAAGCTVKSTDTPALSGPSSLALTLNVSASPDSINQNGGDQAIVRVTAIGPDGKPKPGVQLRLDMRVVVTSPAPCSESAPCFVTQDYGSLSERSPITKSDGVATVSYTAPPSPANGVFGTCSGLPGNCVAIVAAAAATDFSTANPEQVLIRLAPTGVILPPAVTPTAAFTYSPTPVNFNVPVIFDASSSCGGPLSGTACTSTSTISTYAWSFGDGSSGSGKTINHTFTGGGASFNVTLTVTNDRGVSNSVSQTVSASASPAPSGDWVYSPAQPAVGDVIFFNAEGVKAAPGHSLGQFSWSFGDGVSAGGVQTTHTYTAGATYAVVLSVTDDAGQKSVFTKTIVVGSGNPSATFTSSVTNAPAHVMTYDASGSTASNGSSITQYQWAFGDGLSGTGQTVSHTYGAAGTYTIRLTVTDSLGRTGTTTSSVTVP